MTCARLFSFKPYREKTARFCSKKCHDDYQRGQEKKPEVKSRYRLIKVNGRRQLKHRFLVEQAQGAPLPAGIQVHHRNERRQDNRLENLEPMTVHQHQAHHKTKHPKVKTCKICGREFEPHPTKRARAQVCGRDCHRVNLSRITKARRCPPPVAEALVRANLITQAEQMKETA